MLKKSQLTIALFVNVLIFTPVICHAAGADAGQNNANQARQKTYGAQVGEKAMNGVTNLGTAWMEIPKNVVNTTQETNIIYGIIGGLGMGIFNTVGRMSTGLIDLVSAPIPSDPLVNPVRPWNDFDKRTTYGIQYHLEEPTNQMPTY